VTYTQPLLTVFLVVALVGLAHLRNKPGFRTALAGFLGLALVSWPPVDWLVSQPLEMWYPNHAPRALPVQAIVVLSSAVHQPDFERPYPLPDEETYQRCEYAARLYQHMPTVPVLACGGPDRRGGEPYSVTMRELLQRAGVPASAIWTEERSRSTHENAAFGTEILNQHGIDKIALVVDSNSMARAAACFRREGITIVPSSSSKRGWGPIGEEMLPSWRAIRRNESTLHESLGLVWYWLRGWIRLG
jgi:uncharacterized SAM-binding protein YcdF (DUF218 family)